MRINWFKKKRQEEAKPLGLQIRSTFIPPSYDPKKRGNFNEFAETLDKSLKEKFAKSN